MKKTDIHTQYVTIKNVRKMKKTRTNTLPPSPHPWVANDLFFLILRKIHPYLIELDFRKFLVKF